MPNVKHLNDQLYNIRNYQGDRVGFKSWIEHFFPIIVVH